ncbi:phage major capsid protein [Aureimonas ureilytica]|uniref:phage major capsid protein n=1 Tax=Aureimonas ureilytica TaxID=401562 RepID=UPI000AFB4FCF|nr:phage major capsid protein [Aureimonas ureilytica]
MTMNLRPRAGGGLAFLAAGLALLPFGPRIAFDAADRPGGGTKSVAELAAEIKADHKTAIDAVKAIAEDALGKAKAGETLSASVKEKADEALLKMNGLSEQFADLEQKMARAGGRGGPDGGEKSLGERFTDDERVKALLASDGKRGRVDVGVKATITSAVTDTAGAVGNAVNQTRLPGILGLPQRRLTIRDLITPGRMDGNTLEYVKQTGFTNAAATVAEGASKPQSDLKVALVSTTAKVIAHHMKASRQIMDDVPQLQSFIDGQLRYGLAFREEAQILNGDGNGQNLLGIVPQATAYAAAFSPASATPIDTLRLAMLQAALAEFPATGHVLNPIDWTKIELTKDAGGNYIIGVPQGSIGPTLWGLPVVTTQSMAANKFLTGAFSLGAQLFDRWLARVEIATENEDDFVKNLVTILCEERLALAVYRPEAFIYGSVA